MGAVTSVSFSPDGKRIVSGSGDDTVKVWDSQEVGLLSDRVAATYVKPAL